MRVSVVIPTRNRADRLANAIAGVAAQGHPDVELIVVDDGSSPHEAARNAALVQSLPGARHLVLQPTDPRGSGPAQARNAGIAAASGALVAFCDDDDRWVAADFLATAVAAFAADERLDLLFANQQAMSGGATRYTAWQPRLDALLDARGAADGATTPVSRAECLVSAGDFAHMNTCVFRQSLLAATGGFDAGLRYCEDLDLFVRAVDRARAVACLRRTVAVHHVPDRSRRDNASTRIDAHTRHATLDRIARQLVEHCRTAEALDYSRRLGADACRTLARDAAARARGDEALSWARRAGDWRPTLRWTIYTQLLRWRRLVAPRSAAS
ncbi:MAG: glycosyltransferase family 2 protein [Burkholderiales bacterium]|nr:glycosyltransferase family 2 protein [Burkholderiales bacterium]